MYITINNQHNKKKIVIFGSGNQATVAAQEVLKSKKYSLDYFLDVKSKLKFKKINKIKFPIIADYKSLKKEKEPLGIIAIGHNYVRKTLYKTIKKNIPKIKWISLISEDSIIASDVKIFGGSIIMPGCILNSKSIIKSHVIINTGSIIEHDNFLDNFTSVGPGSILGGNVKVSSLSHIGIGSIVLQKIKVGTNSLLGAGSLLNKNIPKNSIYFGKPAKFIKLKSLNFNYL